MNESQRDVQIHIAKNDLHKKWLTHNGTYYFVDGWRKTQPNIDISLIGFKGGVDKVDFEDPILKKVNINEVAKINYNTKSYELKYDVCDKEEVKFLKEKFTSLKSWLEEVESMILTLSS